MSSSEKDRFVIFELMTGLVGSYCRCEALVLNWLVACYGTIFLRLCAISTETENLVE